MRQSTDTGSSTLRLLGTTCFHTAEKLDREGVFVYVNNIHSAIQVGNSNKDGLVESVWLDIKIGYIKMLIT